MFDFMSDLEGNTIFLIGFAVVSIIYFGGVYLFLKIKERKNKKVAPRKNLMT